MCVCVDLFSYMIVRIRPVCYFHTITFNLFGDGLTTKVHGGRSGAAVPSSSRHEIGASAGKMCRLMSWRLCRPY